MYQSQLIKYLSSFSKSELTEFRDFVHSPYFNKHKKTRMLLDHLLATQNWDTSNLKKEKIFQILFPSKAYEEQLLSNVISYLLKLLRRFYMQKQIESKEVDQQLDLLEIALNKGQDKLFLLSAGKLQKRFDQSTIQDSAFFLQQIRYEQLRDDYDLKYGKRIGGEYLKKAMKHFDVYFIGEKFKGACQMLARKQVTGQGYSFVLMEELVQFLEKEEERFSSIPSVWIYFLIYKMMTKSNPEIYFQLKAQLKKQVQQFQKEEGRDLYTHALNYCIGRLNLGETPYRKESFELYQQMLLNGLLYSDGSLPHWDYTNIVSLGCELKEYEWIKQFIFEQKDHLPKANKENTFTYNLAAFHYSQRDYEKSIDLLQKVVFTEIYYNLLTRLLQLRIYFETQNWQALDYNLETFRVYLLRTKQMEEQRRKSGLNLIRFTKSLQRIIESKPLLAKEKYQLKINALKKRILENRLVLNRSWLLLKIEDISVSTTALNP